MIAICTTTIVQEDIEDAYRGRVFAFYDMMVNATFVAGAGLSAAFMPSNGHTPAIIGVVAVGYAVTAAGYWLVQGGGQSPASAGPGSASPSAAAHRSNS